jgi:hypothetical protein
VSGYIKYVMTLEMYRPVPDVSKEEYSSFGTVDEALEYDAAEFRQDPSMFVEATDGNPNATLVVSYDHVPESMVPDKAAFEGGGSE